MGQGGHRSRLKPAYCTEPKEQTFLPRKFGDARASKNAALLDLWPVAAVVGRRAAEVRATDSVTVKIPTSASIPIDDLRS